MSIYHTSVGTTAFALGLVALLGCGVADKDMPLQQHSHVILYIYIYIYIGNVAIRYMIVELMVCVGCGIEFSGMNYEWPELRVA